MRIKRINFILPLAIVFSTSLMGMGDEPHEEHSAVTAPAEQTIRATGTIKMIGEDYKSVRIFHDPIPALKWPAMNMPFDVGENILGRTFNVGDRVRFEFVQKEDKNVIVKISK